MDSPSLKRRLTCILATDAVGYSRLVSADEGNALRVLAAHRAVIDGIIAFHDGRIVSTAGDSVLAEFRSVVDAVRCAVEIQDALKTRNESLPEPQRMFFRIGINLGEVVVKGDDLLGDGVNVAARLESLAQPGGILISSSVYDQITGKLDLGFQDIGEQALKNISRPIRAFRVSGGGRTVRAELASRASPTISQNRAVRAAIGAFAILAVVGGAAWTQGWIGVPHTAVVGVTAADPVKTKLEADLAASEKARADAEKHARTADADAAHARAEAEATTRRTKAEAEGATIRAKAQAEVAAIRSQATQTQEASRARIAEADAIRTSAEMDAVALKRKAESEAAALREKAESEAAALKAKAQLDAVTAQAEAASAAKVAAAAASRAIADAARDDGSWVATYKCSAVGRNPPFVRRSGIHVRGSEFRVERGGVPGEPGYNVASGRPAADGTLVMTGNGFSVQNGQPFEIRFDGRRTGDRFMLQGAFGGRTCEVEIARPGTLRG
jgi:class 3 adenylate cyclase